MSWGNLLRLWRIALKFRNTMTTLSKEELIIGDNVGLNFELLILWLADDWYWLIYCHKHRDKTSGFQRMEILAAAKQRNWEWASTTDPLDNCLSNGDQRSTSYQNEATSDNPCELLEILIYPPVKRNAECFLSKVSFLVLVSCKSSQKNLSPAPYTNL